LWDVADTERSDPMRGETDEFLSSEAHGAAHAAQEPGECETQRRLAHAVPAEESERLMPQG
jgi:hypothetical protein